MPAAGAALAALLLAGCLSGPGAPVSERDVEAGEIRDPKLVHIVREDDTLYSIAFDAGVDYRALARWNQIPPPYIIEPGQALRLRPDPDRPATTATAEPEPDAPAPQPDPAPEAPTEPAELPEPDGVAAGGGWIWPTTGPIIRRFAADSANPGIDIGGQAGQAVKSAANGRVVYSGDGLRGYGELIIVKHNERFLSAYAHNRKLLVSEGEQVRRGQPIAEMGATGTDRVKLHFEIRERGRAVDPLNYLPKT